MQNKVFVNQMNVIYTISSLEQKQGGPTQSVYYTVKGLREQGLIADILTYQSAENDKFISNENYIIALQNKNLIFDYSSEYKQFLQKNPYDLYHTQGIWSYPNYITAKHARKYKKPYIITPRGMLYPQALAISNLKKQTFLKLFLMNDLNKAACIHATCKEEMQHLKNLGVKSPIAVIPNPINIAENNKVSIYGKLRFGYLGRVHPRKNIERLLYVWAKLNLTQPDVELVIIGDGDKQYMDFLKAEQTKLNLRNVVFTGFLTGEAKENALNSLSYLVVPSDFENFGMIIPEALIKGIPVIASKGTPWKELNTFHCGWWVNNDMDTLTETIQEAIETPENKRIEMGKRGKELVKNNYSTEVVAKKMIRLYNWILNDGEKPEFVYL
jgi:glycosyltransferase involved in cell wall biosynthesis